MQKGLAPTAPPQPESFDRVVSSLFFHHLKTDDKRQTLQRVHNLPNGGEFHVADWGRPKGWLSKLAFLTVRLLDGFDVTRDHQSGRFIDLMREVGFSRVEKTGSQATLFGTLSYYKAVR